MLWKQRARSDWLKSGDQNTAFFKAKATRRKKRKTIDQLEKDDGVCIHDPLNILKEFANYFNLLFSSSAGSTQVDWNSAMRNVIPKVTDEMNEKLTEHYIERNQNNFVPNVS